jgi:sarcosine oxidase subunit alpha
MMPAGPWQRPAWYGDPEQRQQQIDSEVLAVRKQVGLIDVSTLGGIEIRGPDAAEFLSRAYTFRYKQQATGTSRYLLMCDNTGAIIDDGVALRLSEDHFYLTTTTSGSETVYRSMLRHAAEWGLDLSIVNSTTAWAAINLAGPYAREIIQQLESDIDFSAEAFPYLAGRQGNVGGAPVMAMRVGFVGELGYELHLPWSCALSVWEQLLALGQGSGIRPVGVEAQRVLRLEKGHLIVGQDTDGLSFPEEAGLGWAVSFKKGYFTGGPALGFLGADGISRQLVGFKLSDASVPTPQECNLVLNGNEISGRVTSVVRSGTLQAVIGLAYVSPEQAKPGSEFSIKLSNGQRVRANTVKLPFYDPDKLRQEL